MGIALSFLPFLAFAVAQHLFGPVVGLALGASISAALIVRRHLNGEPGCNVLEVGTALVFTGLVALAGGGIVAMESAWQVRMYLDGGLVLIILSTIAFRRPFTLQAARRHVSPEVVGSPHFLRANNIVSGAWALALIIMVAVDAWMATHQRTSTTAAVGLSIAAMVAAAGVTIRVMAIWRRGSRYNSLSHGHN